MHNFICPVLFWSARTHPSVNSSVISLLISHFVTSTGFYSISLPQDRGRIFKEIKRKKKWGLNTECCYLYLVWSNFRDKLSGECFSMCFANHLLNLVFTSFPPGFIPRNPMHIYATKNCVLAGIKRSIDFVPCIYFEPSGIICREQEAARLIWYTPNKENNNNNDNNNLQKKTKNNSSQVRFMFTPCSFSVLRNMTWAPCCFFSLYYDKRLRVGHRVT